MARRMVVLLMFNVGCPALTVWPKPQQQSNSGELLAINRSAFRFDSSSESGLLKAAFARYSATIFGNDKEADRVAAGKKGERALAAIDEATVTLASSDETLDVDTDWICATKPLSTRKMWFVS